MYTTIVVGTDGSRQAERAVDAAATIAEREGLASIHVVAAGPEMTAHELAELRRRLPEEFRVSIDNEVPCGARFDAADRIAAPHGVSVRRHPASGNAAEAILDVAEHEQADLVVVGARGLGPVGRFVRGSTSTRVAHHSPCDVLIVEPAAS